MKMLKLISLCFITSLFWACDKDTPMVIDPQPPVVTDTIFELQWTNRIEFDEETGGADYQFIHNNDFINFGDLNYPAIIYGFNKIEGDKSWKYEYKGWDNSNIDYAYKIEHILICVTGFRVFGFNLNLQSVEWDHNLSELNLLRDSGNVGGNNKFYLNVSENFDPLGGFDEILLEFDPYTGEKKEIVKYTPTNAGTTTLSPPVWKNGIIYYNLYPNAEASPTISRQMMVAFDMNTNQELWRSSVTDVFASNSLHSPIIYNDLIITGGDWHIYAFDIHTGEQVWKYEETNTNKLAIWSNTNHLIHENKLYVNATGFNVTCLNPATGELIWNNPMGGPNCTDNMVYYEKEDLLVFTSWGYGSVMILDALTGETIHRENSYDDSPYNNDVVYDPEMDMFFTSTYKHAMGFKVRRPE